MTARERHGLTERAIDSVVAQTRRPYRFIYLDVQSPPWLRAVLARRAAEWQLEVVSFDEPLWPQQARQRVAAQLDSDYIVFIDNDVEVGDAWLERLLDCADQTGAGIVGPLYLWSDGVQAPTVHMAGGKFDEYVESEGRVLGETHELINADPRAIAAQLQRRPCDFVEFHCMLMRREVLDGGRALDPGIRCVHEHIDVALSARERGYAVYFEPGSSVTYLAFAPYSIDDLPLLRGRWAEAEGEASIREFSRKWNVIDDQRSFWGVRTFLRRHVAQIDPIRPASLRATDLHLAIGRDELCQTRSDLLDLAQRRGYVADELRTLSDSYTRAQMLANAGYRPCGRPFLNHLVGTAGVLLRYGFRVETVAAALLHAAYTHCPPVNGGAHAAVAQVEALLAGKGSPIECRVRAYTQREHALASSVDLRRDTGPASVFEAEIVAIAAANEIDMHLSGEIRYSGRTDLISSTQRERIARVCSVLGVTGLSATLDRAAEASAAVAAEWQSHLHSSYRIGGRTPAPISMLSDAPSALGPAAAPSAPRTGSGH